MPFLPNFPIIMDFHWIATPEIFHSGQGKQYTCGDFTDKLKKHKIVISMSGKGRCFDNILAERLWRTVKYEEVTGLNKALQLTP